MSTGAASPEAVAGVVRLLRPLTRHLGRSLASRLRGTGVSAAAASVLEILAEQGPQTVPAIARQWTVGRQNVQRVADVLIERGLVERVQNAGHRKSVRLGLTPEGARTYRELEAGARAVLGRVATGLGRDDVDACQRVLRHLEAGFRFDGGVEADQGAAQRPPE
jgi:DNA-binding MarR family transcriptional regulator